MNRLPKVFGLSVSALLFGGVLFAQIPTLTASHGVSAPHDPSDSRLDDPEIQRIIQEDHARGTNPGCLSCHGDIESATVNMGFEISCVFCHGGDGDATTMADAHVQPTQPVINDNTTLPLDYDLPYQRFINPGNLRVTDQTCGQCHPFRLETTLKSMMATATGHYAGGLYQNGVVNTKTPIYGTFAVSDDDGNVPVGQGAVPSVLDLITYDPLGDPNQVATHFAAVPAQACARCHLWSRGRGYRGAVDQDGTYRADGCVACHMPYANDGRSLSADASIDHVEQGHPKIHTITKAIPTEQCLHCHHRGARIGLTFTGRAQMPPGLPSGPGVPGTTDERFNRSYHYTDPHTNPQDLHGERGLHCIDCHTKTEVMGDGNIFGHMDQATKIECRTCHGVPDAPGTFVDHDGLLLWNVDTSGPAPVLTSKVDGQEHTIKQVMNVVDSSHPDFNPRAARAMTPDHLKVSGGLECYSCHSAWVPNCFGCHFERDEREMGQNLVTRQWEVGKVSTNNKVFETLRPFWVGPNSEGRVAPYIVGCQPIADVTAPDGSKILDFKMPETTNGLSGLALQPVQPHSVRAAGEVRACVECHRSPASLGLGTGSYSLARTHAYTVADDGIRVFDRWTNPTAPTFLSTLTSSAPKAIAVHPDVVDGSADYLYVARTAGIDIFHLESGLPGAPVATVGGIDPIDLSRSARYLYAVDEGVGIIIYDAQNPVSLNPVATVPLPTARKVVAWGIHLLVAAGPQGFFTVDISDPTHPLLGGSVPEINAADVIPYAHYQGGNGFALRAYVADPEEGVHVIDLLPTVTSPTLRNTLPIPGAQALDTYTRYQLTDGLTPSREHDYLYVAAGSLGLRVYDVTAPDAIVSVSTTTLGGHAMDVDVSSQINPPGVDDYAVVANSTLGLQFVEVSDPSNPNLLATLPAPGASRAFVDVQQMDRFLDEQGETLKENSHPFTGTFDRADIVRILGVPLENDAEATCCLPGNGCGEMLPADCVAMGGTVGIVGAVCEADFDGDGVSDSCDSCSTGPVCGAPVGIPTASPRSLLMLAFLLAGGAILMIIRR